MVLVLISFNISNSSNGGINIDISTAIVTDPDIGTHTGHKWNR